MKSFSELFQETLDRKERISKQINALYSIRDDRIHEKTSLLSSISFSNAYLERKDEVNEMLTTLQEKMQRKAKGFFEDLLTELVNEVLPNENGQIVLDLTVKNNRTSLDVCIVKDGKKEDVFVDNGGALTNVISMGLRFIVLSRSSNRRFLIFDEADAWIKPDNIPYFIKVINELSVKLGIQVVVISHHDIDFFKSSARVIRLERDIDGHIISKVENEPVLPENTPKGGFKSLRLRGYKSHTNTLIPFSPYVTVIYGDNNIGKSHISRAFNSLRNSDTIESNINHNANFCRVDLVLEDDSTLVWEYHRSAKRKTQYTLLSKEGVEIESSHLGGKVPVWLNDYLFMDDINGLDVHVVDQKYPVYLIGSNVSSFQRAEMLSLGGDNENVKFMIKKHLETIKEHQANIRASKKRLSYIEKDLKLIRSISLTEEYVSKSEELSKKIIASEETLVKVNEFIVSIKKIKDSIDCFEKLNSVNKDLLDIERIDTKVLTDIRTIANNLSTYIRNIDGIKVLESKTVTEVPVIYNISTVRESVESILAIDKKIKALTGVVGLSQQSNVPDLSNVSAIRELCTSMTKHLKVIESFGVIPNKISEINEMSDVSKIKEQAKKLDGIKREESVLIEKIKSAKEELKIVSKDEQEYLDKIRHSCPLCKTKLDSVILENDHV